MATISITPPNSNQIKEYNVQNLDVVRPDVFNVVPDLRGADLSQKAPITLENQPFPVSDNYGTLYNMLYQPFAGANDILTKLPDEIINVGAEIGEKLGFVKENETSRNYLNRLFNSNDYETKKVLIPYILSYGLGEKVDPTGAVAKTLRGIGEGTALTLPISGGLLSKGSKALEMPLNYASQAIGTKMGPTFQRIYQDMARSYGKNPVFMTALDTLFGGLSGGGAEMGGQLEKDIYGTDTGIGASAGAMAPTIAVPGLIMGTYNMARNSFIGRGFGFMKNWLTGQAKRDAEVKATDEVQKQIKKAYDSGDGLVNAQRAEEIATDLAPYANEEIIFTPAEMTLDAPLTAEQKNILGAADPDFIRANQARIANIINAVRGFMKAKFDYSPTVNNVESAPTMVMNVSKNKLETIANNWQKGSDKWSDKLEDITTSGFNTLDNKAQVGTNIAKRVEEAKKNALQNLEDLATTLGINNTDEIASASQMGSAQTQLSAMLPINVQDSLSYKGLPKIITEFLKRPKDKITFQDWKIYKEQISNEIGKALAVKDKTGARMLISFSKIIDDFGGAFANTKPNFETFNKAYNEQYTIPFSNGRIQQVLSKDAGSSDTSPIYLLDGEAQANAFIGSVKAIKQFNEIFPETGLGTDRITRADLKNVIIDDLVSKSMSGKAGERFLDPGKVQQYINKNSEWLKEFGIWSDLSQQGSALQYAFTRKDLLHQRAKTVSNSRLWKAVMKANDTDKPQKLLNSAFDDLSILKDLKQIAISTAKKENDPGVLKAFNQSVMETLLKKAPSAMENPAKFKQWINENSNILDTAFSKGHTNNMFVIADAFERALLTGMEEGPGIGARDFMAKVQQKIGSSFTAIQSRFYAQAEGRISPRTALIFLLGRAYRANAQAKADAIFENAMMDPEFAKMLLKQSEKDFTITPELDRQIGAYFFNMGIPYFYDTPEQRNMIIPLDDVKGPPKPQTITIEPTSASDLTEPEPLPQTQPIPNVSQLAMNTTAPSPANTNVNTSVSELFPFDPTSQAIENRRGSGGITNLIG